MQRYGLISEGSVTTDGPWMGVINPATGNVFAEAARCTSEQLDRTVASAQAAFRQWRAVSLDKRRAALTAAAASIKTHANEIAQLLTAEQGKPLAEAMIEVMATAYWFATAPTLPIERVIHEDSPQRLCQTIYEPLGVVAAIVPWNVPLLQIGFKVPLALYAGNSVILKPSPFTPIASLRLGQLLLPHFPRGLFNVLSGDDALGPLLSDHPDIAKISFTGSTVTGQRIMADAARDLKRVTLELGGNDPAIILDDVDIEQTAQSIFWAGFRNTGQLCVATKRVFVQDTIYDRFRAALVRYADQVRIGSGFEEGVQLGPIQNARQYERVIALMDGVRAAGYPLAREGGAIDGPGYFISPMIVDNPPDDADIVKDEQFGPIMPLLRFSTIEEAIARANASGYGLAATVWTNDADKATEIAARLDAGTVWINEIFHFSPVAPFGGRKKSGIGTENGEDGLHAFLQPKTIVAKRLSTTS